MAQVAHHHVYSPILAVRSFRDISLALILRGVHAKGKLTLGNFEFLFNFCSQTHVRRGK